MLAHLRTRALEKYKTELNLTLESGKGFAAAVRDTTESNLNEFDQGCAGKLLKLLIIYIDTSWPITTKFI